MSQIVENVQSQRE